MIWCNHHITGNNCRHQFISDKHKRHTLMISNSFRWFDYAPPVALAYFVQYNIHTHRSVAAIQSSSSASTDSTWNSFVTFPCRVLLFVWTNKTHNALLRQRATHTAAWLLCSRESIYVCSTIFTANNTTKPSTTTTTVDTQSAAQSHSN